MELLETIEKVFGANLLKLRTKMGLSQDDMAHKLGIPESTYKKWEQGKQIPRVEQRRKMRVEYGIKETALFLDPDLINPSDEQILARITDVFSSKAGLQNELQSLFSKLNERQIGHFIRMIKTEVGP